MVENPYQLLAVFLGIILLSVWLDSRFSWARNISPVLMIIFFAGLLSNLGLITDRSEFYDQVIGFTVPFAVCLILFTVNLSDLRRSGAPLLAAFGVACFGTVIGVVTAGLLLDSALAEVMGVDRWKLAGPFTGTYTGGSLNFFAMWEGLGIDNPDLFAAANAVDNLTIFPLFAVWVLVPKWLGKWYPSSQFWGAMDANGEAAEQVSPTPELRTIDIVGLSFAAVAIMVASDLINIKSAIVLAPVLFAYVLIMIFVHMVSVYGIGRLLGLDIRVLTIASCAAKSGPATVVPLANLHGWKNLVLPGMAMGLLGYAVGNYLGFATAYTMKALLGQ